MRERHEEPQAHIAAAQLPTAPASERTADIAKDKIRPPVSFNVLLETLGVTLAFFGGGILLNWLGPQSQLAVTTHGIIASSVTDLGWILLVICLLNRGGPFQWKLPQSKKSWGTEFVWGAAILLINGFAQAFAKRIGWELRVPSGPTVWVEALRNHNTWLAFQVIAPVSAAYQELVCRVYMQSRLTQIFRGDSVFAVVISSLLFTGIHHYPPLQLIGVFVAGLVYGASYQLNGKIPRLVIAHAANNIIKGFT